MSSSSDRKLAHVALLPSAGMGHLTPFLRLAASLTLQNVNIKHQQFHLLPLDNPLEDPFFEHFRLIKESSHLLSPLLSALSPPLSVFITDMSLVSAVIPITEAISLPNYVLFTSSAKMLTLFLSYPTLAESKAMDELDEMDVVRIRGLELVPKSLIPPPLLKKGNNILKTCFLEDSKKVAESSGILVNTFESFEQESLRTLNDCQILLKRLPSVVAIGPLPPCDFEKGQLQLTWLHDQPAGSVMYVSFGSRTALSREQVRELGEGLVRSGRRFVWVVKDKKVDTEDNEGLEERIGLGTWVKSWGWGQETVVNRAEIAEKIREIMGNESLRIQALSIKEEARKAVGAGGSSNKGLSELINIWRKF
ncbi:GLYCOSYLTRANSFERASE [Salix koriyanagi]|uniref:GLYCOSYLTRANSFERASE n=1 Tax=Salix koriyanagi TaxID=2511006 RepID=A0A9Q0UZS1_9ROSI|nr:GLYCOSYLTRANSFERASE [Salix koriyanagi]